MIGNEQETPRSFVLVVWILSLVGLGTLIVGAAKLGDLIGAFIRGLIIG
jgi:hypothetical protein